MALTTKRIIALPSQSEPQEGDYLAIDNAQGGTHKIPVGSVGVEVDDTLTEQGKAADAKATGDALDEIRSQAEATDDAIDELRSQIEVTGAASGAIATFTDGAEMPAKSVIVNIEPQQSGTGTPSPDNVRPISGWESVNVYKRGVNVWGGVAMANGIKSAIPQAVLDADAKTISYASGYATEGSNFTSGLPFKANTQYTIILKFSNTKARTNVKVWYTDGTNQYIPTSVTGLQTVVFTTAANKTIDYIGGMNSDGTSVFYYDECGVFEGVLTADQFKPYQGQTITKDLGRTVYGGTLDVVSGVLTVDRAMVDLGTLTWETASAGTFYSQTIDNYKTVPNWTTVPNIMCSWYQTTYGDAIANASIDKAVANYGAQSRVFVRDTTYSNTTDFKTAMSGVQLVYELATPQTYQLTPTEVSTILGENNVWADSGDVEAVYIRDLNIAINNLLNSNGTRSLGMMAMSAPAKDTAEEPTDEQSDEQTEEPAEDDMR